MATRILSIRSRTVAGLSESRGFEQRIAQPEGQKAASQAQHGIEKQREELRALRHQEIFIHEGGKGGKASAQPDGEKNAQFLIDQCTAVKKAVQNAEEKTSGQIDGQSAEGKPFHDGIIQAAGKKVPENSADEASQADQEDAFHGGNISNARQRVQTFDAFPEWKMNETGSATAQKVIVPVIVSL